MFITRKKALFRSLIYPECPGQCLAQIRGSRNLQNDFLNRSADPHASEAAR